MTHLLSNVIVAVAIALSLGYACWRLGPQRLRNALRAQLQKYSPRHFAAPAAPSSGCGGCTGCSAATLARQAPASCGSSNSSRQR